MAQSRTVLPFVAGVVALVLAGCGAGGGEPEAPAASSGSASPSASASASPSPSESAMSKAQATAATTEGLLPGKAFAKVGLEVSRTPKTDRWDWFSACSGQVPSDARMVIGRFGSWTGDGLAVGQTVTAYPAGVAEEVVGEVRDALDCTEYTTSESDYSKVAKVSLPDGPKGDEAFAWCEVMESEDLHKCTSVVAYGDLVSNIWALSGTKDTALDALGALTTLARARLEVQAED